MASGALFGGSNGRTQSKNLVEFRAGKMFMKGKMVHPDKRKGQVYLYQSDDNLMHFCWKDRTSGTVEDDLIIFPEDAEFKHVPQCTTGRVFLLRFKNSSRKFFFWMQEPKSDKDDDNMQKINEYMNNPPTPGSSRAGGGGGLGGLGSLPPELAASGIGESDLQNLLGNMSQQQLMQLLGGMGMGGMGGLSTLLGGGGRPSSAQSTDSAPPLRVQSSPGPRATTTTTAADTTPTPARPVTAAALPSQPAVTPARADDSASPQSASGIQLSDLQNILSGMQIPEGAAEKEGIDLSQAVTPDVIIPIMANKDVQEKLIPFLPEGETLPKTEAELRNTVKSPQFQQAMSVFSAALASGQLGPLMGQFGLGAEAVNAATQGDVEAFAKALQGEKKGDKDEEKKEEKKE